MNSLNFYNSYLTRNIWGKDEEVASAICILLAVLPSNSLLFEGSVTIGRAQPRNAAPNGMIGSRRIKRAMKVGGCQDYGIQGMIISQLRHHWNAGLTDGRVQ